MPPPQPLGPTRGRSTQRSPQGGARSTPATAGAHGQNPGKTTQSTPERLFRYDSSFPLRSNLVALRFRRALSSALLAADWRRAVDYLWSQRRHDPMRSPGETVSETTRPSVGYDGPDDPLCTSHSPIAKATDAVPNEAPLAADQRAAVWAPVGLSPCLAPRAETGRRAGMATTKDASRNHKGKLEARGSSTRSRPGPERPARRRAFVRCAQPESRSEDEPSSRPLPPRTTDENQRWPCDDLTEFATDFWRGMSRKRPLSVLRSPRVVGRARDCAWLVFAEGGLSTSGCGVRLCCGREPMTCRSAGVWGSRACRATCPSRALLCAPRCHELAPALSFLGDAACQSATERL